MRKKRSAWWYVLWAVAAIVFWPVTLAVLAVGFFAFMIFVFMNEPTPEERDQHLASAIADEQEQRGLSGSVIAVHVDARQIHFHAPTAPRPRRAPEPPIDRETYETNIADALGDRYRRALPS
jgi:hypothetical protein